jgi:hypothetical protein
VARINWATTIAPAPTGVSGDTQSLRQCQLGWHSAISLFQLREDLASPRIQVSRGIQYGTAKLDLNKLSLRMEKVIRPRDVTVREPRADYGNALACSSGGIRFLPKGWKIVRQCRHLI